MASKQSGPSIGSMVLVLIVVLVIEAVADFFGLPFDEILVPGEIIGDILLMILMAMFTSIGYTPTRRIQ